MVVLHRKRPVTKVRLNVHHATVKSIRRTVKSHRKRILKAQKLRRRRYSHEAPEFDCDLPAVAAAAAVVLRKAVSTDSDELEVDVGSEEDQDEETKRMRGALDVDEDDEERGFEVDSGCDEWDLSKDT